MDRIDYINVDGIDYLATIPEATSQQIEDIFNDELWQS